MVTELVSECQDQGQLKYIQPRLNDLFCLPLVKTDNGLSISAEIMASIWQQICYEGKKDDLFYDGGITNLKEWLDYIYNPSNHVILVVNDEGHIYHIAWLNKYYKGHGFVHHCALGNYNRKTWPTIKKYWQSMRDDNGNPIVRTVLGVTPVINEKAVRLLKLIGWTPIGSIPGICFIKHSNSYVPGVISYCQINEA